MRVVPRSEILFEKELRRREIKELERDIDGDLIHIGKPSMGCYTCFLRNPLNNIAIYTGVECNAACPYCYYDKGRTDKTWNTTERIAKNLAEYYQMALDPQVDIDRVSYNSHGETLMYMYILKEAAKITRKHERTRGHKIYSHLYTNGILATEEILKELKEIEVTELRFHVSASHFSKKVFDNMRLAKKMGFVVTVEEPSLLENREELFEHLPIFEEIGIKHFNLIECQVTPDNYAYLDKAYPEGRYYRDELWHLYDEGMVYDIMEEKIKKNYSFSMIDCNSRVEVCRQSSQVMNRPPGAELPKFEEVRDIFADFDRSLDS